MLVTLFWVGCAIAQRDALANSYEQCFMGEMVRCEKLYRGQTWTAISAKYCPRR